MKIDGGFHCGYITYEAEADPANAMICHCTDCQNSIRFGFSECPPHSARFFQTSFGRIANLR